MGTATAKTKDEADTRITEGGAQPATASATTDPKVESGEAGSVDARVIQYGDKYGLFKADGTMIKGDIESRFEANQQRDAMVKKGSKSSKAVEDDDGSR